ncbi:LOW QUALITY PROTEIN: hypothetical protein HID58_059702 [Brassica napus]|uniref:Uncharacterized protein n=1 Tax=Brassica napus TaxID=3708 RepID=A0ABQ7ZTP0_BRANA|nr:LOW QUALITY PROTEIN: hypothetical protein HID58_059702 [Brassica napus]
MRKCCFWSWPVILLLSSVWFVSAPKCFLVCGGCTLPVQMWGLHFLGAVRQPIKRGSKISSGSGKIVILAGLWLWKECVPCRLVHKTNSTSSVEPPTESQSTNEATTEQEKKLSWKLKLIMGTLSLNPFDRVSAASLVMIIIMVAIIVRTRNERKNERNTENVEAIDFERGEIMTIFGDQITKEEEKIAKKMVLVGLWCIQTNPSLRPAMIKVIEMLEGSIEALQVPPKPLLCLPAMVPETVEDSNETSSFSNPSQFERGSLSASEDTLRFPTKSFKNLMKEVESSSKPSSNKVSKASESLT